VCPIGSPQLDETEAGWGVLYCVGVAYVDATNMINVMRHRECIALYTKKMSLNRWFRWK
jgi:hypothetical protein